MIRCKCTKCGRPARLRNLAEIQSFTDCTNDSGGTHTFEPTDD